ncbi:MAG: sugar transferase [Acidobacteria bacterium]|nr:sugar transferase [Acidobacteriota bacterium]
MASIGGQAIPRRTLLLIASEALLTSFALLLAMGAMLRGTPSPWQILQNSLGLWRFLIALTICMLSFYYNDLYDLQVRQTLTRTSVKLTRGLGCALFLMAVVAYFSPRLSPGQGVALIAAPTIMLLIISSRIGLRATATQRRGAERLLLVGSGALGKRVLLEMADRGDMNCSVVGHLSEDEQAGSEQYSLPYLGAVRELERICKEQRIDRIVLSMRERRGGMPVRELMRLKFQGVRIDDPYSLYERMTGRIVVENISPSFFIFSNGFKVSRVTRSLKRVCDFIIALVGLVVTAPIMLLVAMAIQIEDRGPVFYCQNRVGANRAVFRIYKFRSMRVAAPGTTPSWTTDGDRRITRVGHYLRLFRIDELPQFLNVLRGDMSLVGPRPEQPYFCTLLEEKLPYFSYRHTVRPGITGWAQVKYGYGATTEDALRKLELDLFYIKHLSVSLDLAVMFETVKVVLFGRGK